jgi:IS605 OrfB family transposase
VKHLTISRDGGMWYVSFSVERKVRPEVHAQRARVARLIEVGALGAQPEHAQSPSGDSGRSPDGVRMGAGAWGIGAFGAGAFDALVVTGVDRNTPQNGSCVTNWGDVFGVQVRTAEREQKLARLQRTVARKEEAFRKAHEVAPGGSLKPLRLKGIEEPKALREARADLAAFHGYLARCRKDIQHKTSRSITDMSDIVGFEALETKEMTAAPGTVLGDGSVKVPTVSKRTRKDILDAGWSGTERMVAYKCGRAGKRIVRVNPAYTSQGCSACAHVEEKNRQGKVFCCVACGHTADADVNAGWNVRTRTIAALVAQTKTHAINTSVQTKAPEPALSGVGVKGQETGTAGSVGVAPGGSHKGLREGRKRTVAVEGRQALEKPQRAASG